MAPERARRRYPDARHRVGPEPDCRAGHVAGRPDRACGALGQGSAGRSPLRMARGRGMATHTARRSVRDRQPDCRHRHAWPMDSPCLDGRCGPMAAAQPALCINERVAGQPGRISGAQRAFIHARGPASRSVQGRGPLTTDRLVTPFHASRAQSGPRKVSPMNFSEGSRSIQRLLTARPLLTCWSRGRA
jgi:hypothetical protein